MGIIKLEIDVPDFEKEISINVTLKKDGEVVDSIVSSPSSRVSEKGKSRAIEAKPESSMPAVDNSFLSNGNLMDMEY
jgi:hypothetical protein